MSAIKQNKDEIFLNKKTIMPSISQVVNDSKSLWGGYFEKKPTALNYTMLSAIDTDSKLYAVAIESAKVHSRMLAKLKIISDVENKKIVESLDNFKKDFIEGKVTITSTTQDIYDAIHAHLEKSLGDNLASSMQVARSKHDYRAADLRMWLRDACHVLDHALQNLQATIIDKAEENVKTIMPSNIHMRPNQSLSLGHHLMSYVEMTARDRQRLKDTRIRTNISPLGACNLTGTSIELPTTAIAKMLEFESVSNNSIDAVSDRDFIIDFLSCASISMMHLSRLAEEMLLWQHPHFNFISFSPSLLNIEENATGRRHPKIIELVRAKTSSVYGNLMSVLSLMKSLHTTVSQDLEETIQPMIQSYDVFLSCINIMSALVADFTVNKKEMKEAAQSPDASILDITEWLIVNLKHSYNQAYGIAEKIVIYAQKSNTKLSLLELSELKGIESKINKDIYSVLIPSRALISRRSAGGTNPVQLRKAIRAAKRKHI